MGWYRRLMYDAFRRCCRKISPVESFCSRSNPTGSRISQPIFRTWIMQNVVKNKIPNSFAKRFYSKVNHLRANEFGAWYEKRRNLIRLGFLGCGASCVYYWNLETVPFTKRRHFVLASTCLEKKLGDKFLELGKLYKIKENLVASHHPESMRVEKIGQNIIGALLKGLRKSNEHATCANLEKFNWEFIVVDEPTNVNAFCLPGGKIVVHTGMLNYLKTDDEIANVIGHEVGHAVARHHMSGIYWLLLIQHFMSDRFKRLSDLFIRFPLCWRYEMEADYIGLLVSASAGYDPRIAPEVCLKLENYSPSGPENYHSTHPHGNKRAQLVSQPKVMEKALSMYREALKDKDKDRDKEGQRRRGYLNFLNRFLRFFFHV